MSIQLSFDKGAVIVAGGTGGIGEAICKRFAEAGLPVIFTYHSSEQKAARISEEITAAGGKCEYHKVNLPNEAEVKALFDDVKAKYGKIAQVVYAAGPAFDFAKIGQIPVDVWKGVIDTDINGAFNITQNAIHAFQDQGGGNLVAVITCAVECVPKADIMSASPKAAIEMLIRGVAKEYGKENIRANCVGPGWINAGLGKKGLEEKLTPEMVEKIRRATIPLQKFGEADDIAYATVFLCSQQAKFITGQSLHVDGGAQI